MKDYGKIMVTQRTAIGSDDSGKTKLYVVKNVHSNNGDVVILQKEDADEMVQCNQSTMLGTITVIHPAILAGSWEDNVTQFCRMALDKLEQDGIIVRSKYGTCFLAS